MLTRISAVKELERNIYSLISNVGIFTRKFGCQYPLRTFTPFWQNVANFHCSRVDQKEEMTGKTLQKIGDLSIRMLTMEDRQKVEEFLTEDFLLNEPLSKAVRLTKEGGQRMFEEIAKASLDSSLSYAFIDARDNIAAVRLCNMLERPADNKSQGLFSELEKLGKSPESFFTPAAYEVVRIVDALEQKTWFLVPSEIKRLLNTIVLSCHRNYTRRGLSIALMEVDMEKQMQMGIQGGISELTAHNSQQLFKKLGYAKIYEIKHNEWLDKNGKRIFMCDDSTATAQLAFKRY